MGILSRAQIEAAEDLGREVVEVPEWGGSVVVRMMTAGEHTRLGQEYEGLPKDRLVFHLLAKVIVDDAGEALFAGEDGVEALAGKSKDVVLRLYKLASRLNGLGKDDVEAAAKN